MDVRIEAAAAVAEATVVSPEVKTVTIRVLKVTIERKPVASFSCPSLGSHSISAVAPDHNFMRGTALVAA